MNEHTLVIISRSLYHWQSQKDMLVSPDLGLFINLLFLVLYFFIHSNSFFFFFFRLKQNNWAAWYDKHNSFTFFFCDSFFLLRLKTLTDSKFYIPRWKAIPFLLPCKLLNEGLMGSRKIWNTEANPVRARFACFSLSILRLICKHSTPKASSLVTSLPCPASPPLLFWGSSVI